MENSMKRSIKLNDGVEIPLLGLGTWQSRGKKCEHAVEFALTHGYLMIDTAQGYHNERQVGKGWKASGQPREDIFITTKISSSNQGYDKTKRSLEDSLEKLQTDYVDLLLIHWPKKRNFSLTVETWQALVELQKSGLTRSIGVSNFTIPLLEKLTKESDVYPAVNQVEFHTFLYQKELLDYCHDKDIQIEAYSPIARAKFLDNKEIQRMAKKHDKTPAQVMLAWGINHDLVVIPKSTHEGRILENSDIFFKLGEEDMQVLNNLGPSTRLVDGPWAPDW
ncbi:MAG: aldo/keto reductase [Chloroflexota bacterium]|nr:aldo/keto reductase [Chloroflexota bacterium]